MLQLEDFNNFIFMFVILAAIILVDYKLFKILMILFIISLFFCDFDDYCQDKGLTGRIIATTTEDYSRLTSEAIAKKYFISLYKYIIIGLLFKFSFQFKYKYFNIIFICILKN